MNTKNASDRFSCTTRKWGRNQVAYHIPSICLPTNCIDIALAIPLLRSYTYNFTGEDMVVMGVVIEGVSDVIIYCCA